jgi:hypothetical protein
MTDDPPEPTPEALDIYSSAKAAAAGFSIALGAAWMLDFIGIGLMMQLTFHEFGHAAAAWLSGRWAIPIPIAAFTFWGESRSALVTLLVGAGFAFLFKLAWERNRYWLLALATLGLGIMISFALMPRDEVEMWGVFAGVAGEMILSGILISAFFWDLAEIPRWDFWRYPVLLAAACAWLQSASLWTGTNIGLAGWSMRAQDAAVAHDPLAFIEWLANTPGDNDQDFYRLVHTYGWKTREIAAAYRRIAAGTLAVIALSGAFSLAGGLRRARAPAPGL